MGKALAAGIAGLGVTVASQLTGNPKVKVKVAGKEKETTLNKAALAGVAASKVPDLAVAGVLATPEADPAVARSAAAAKDLAGTAAAKFAQAATKAETAVNNAMVNAMGKTAEVAGKISPKAGETIINPAVYKAANDALSSYAPMGAPEQSKAGIIGGLYGSRHELMDIHKNAKDSLYSTKTRAYPTQTEKGNKG